MKTRIDCHCPTKLNPADYQYVGWMYQGGSEEVWAGISSYDTDFIHPERLRNHKRLFDGNYKEKHTCDHCGASFAWGIIYRHRPTNTLVVVGNICAAERFNLASRVAWIRKQIEKKVEAIRKKHRLQKQTQKWLDEHKDLIGVLGQDAKPNHYILQDLKTSLWHYGGLTKKQTDLAYKIKREEVERAEGQEQWKEETENAEDVTEGKKIKITGTIISTRAQKSPYSYCGNEYKMLVKDDQGFRVWGTVPNSLFDGKELKGRRIQFIATLERSKGDPKFGFFKRPRKAEYIEEVESTKGNSK